MIARTWRGWTREEDADRYLEYLDRTGLSGYRETGGNRGAWVFRRLDGGRAEFLVLSLWESMEAVRGFAGPEPEKAVFYDDDDHFLIDRELHVSHYEVVRSPEA